MEIQPKTLAGKRKRGEMRLTVAGGIFTAILSVLLGSFALDLLKDTAHAHEIMWYVITLVTFACFTGLYLMKLAYEDIDSCETNASVVVLPNSHLPSSNSANACVVIEHGETKITIRIE